MITINRLVFVQRSISVESYHPQQSENKVISCKQINSSCFLRNEVPDAFPLSNMSIFKLFDNSMYVLGNFSAPDDWSDHLVNKSSYFRSLSKYIIYKGTLHNLSSMIKTNTNPPSHLCDLLNKNFFPQLELLIGDTMDLCPSTLRIPALRLK